MSQMIEALGVEPLLQAFHARHPGVTSRALADVPACDTQGQVHASSYAALLAALPQDLHHAHVLDLACGDGYLLAALAPRAATVCGVDISAAELRAAQQRLGATAHLCQGRAQALPFATGSFDYVVCHLALMLMEQAETVFAEIRRVLRPGGELLAVLGAAGAQSPATQCFVACLNAHQRLPAFASVRLGDRRLVRADTLAAVCAPEFESVSWEDLTLHQRLTPDALWAWWLEMYDLFCYSPAQQADIRTALWPQLQALCATEPDGKTALDTRLRLLRARTAAC